MPYFIDELTVTGICLGREIPIIRRVAQPYLDDRGLWVDVDVAYGGGFTMSLETKVNLMKLKRSHGETTADVSAMAAVMEDVKAMTREKR